MNNRKYAKLLLQVSKPGRYAGGEVNSIRKDLSVVSLKFALAFPDLYEIGVSNLGLHILYHILNDRDDIAAERVCAPWDDMEAMLRREEMPLSSLESALPLSDFDIVGFSLQHELSYTNLLNMLDLGGIPLLSRERDRSHPLVIAGGPAAFNPEPMADFVDAFLAGDGEEAVIDICDVYLAWKKNGGARTALLHALAEVEGVYVPALFEFSFEPDDRIASITPLKDGYGKAMRRIVKDLKDAPYPTRFIVPNVRPVHERIPLEVARGCSRFCHFCQAGYVYLPVRERSPQFIDSAGRSALGETGLDEVALLSLSTGDYSCLEGLLPALAGRYSADRVNLSFPSLRVDTITPTIMQEMKKMRAKGFTIAPEAGSQRLRDLINKGVTEEQILHTVREMSGAGTQMLKLYFMIGLPTETMADLDEIIRLSRLILKTGRSAGSLKNITVNLSSFVPKPHTPFQWARQDGIDETKEKHNYLKRNLKDRGISLKWQDSFMSLLEGVFSRGDRRLGALVLSAYRKGCRFDGWGDQLNEAAWREALDETQTCVERLLSPRGMDDILPWEIIGTGVSRDFLLKELERSGLGVPTEDCRIGRCSACGVCDHRQILNRTFAGEQVNLPPATSRRQTPLRTKLRVGYSKAGPAALVGHMDSMHSILCMMRRAGVPLAYSEGFHPHPKISFASPLPLGTESLSEFFDIEIEGHMPATLFSERVIPRLPVGMGIVSVEEIGQGTPSIADAIEAEVYHVELPEGAGNEASFQDVIGRFAAAASWPAVKEGKKGPKEIDLKEMVLHLSLASPGKIEIKLSARGGRHIRAEEAAGIILGIPEETRRRLYVIKRETLFRQPDSSRRGHNG